MILTSGGSSIFPRVVHQSVFPSIWPTVPSLRRGMSTNPGFTTWCVCECSWIDDTCRVCVCVCVWQRGHSGDGCDLASTLCWYMYDLRKGDLFVLGWARVRRVTRGSISSELMMCGGDVCNILLVSRVVRCLETIYVYGACFIFIYVVVTVWVCGNVCCVAAVVEYSVLYPWSVEVCCLFV